MKNLKLKRTEIGAFFLRYKYIAEIKLMAKVLFTITGLQVNHDARLPLSWNARKKNFHHNSTKGVFSPMDEAVQM